MCCYVTFYEVLVMVRNNYLVNSKLVNDFLWKDHYNVG